MSNDHKSDASTYPADASKSGEGIDTTGATPAAKAEATAQKERPDFLDGYDAGMADARRIAERDKAEATGQAEPAPYCYVYEYDTPLGSHRALYPKQWNGSRPSRTVPVYTHPAPAAPAVPDDTRRVVEQCRDALAEELGAWDIDPPLHHVKEAHDACVAWLAAAPQAPAPADKEPNNGN